MSTWANAVAGVSLGAAMILVLMQWAVVEASALFAWWAATASATAFLWRSLKRMPPAVQRSRAEMLLPVASAAVLGLAWGFAASVCDGGHSVPWLVLIAMWTLAAVGLGGLYAAGRFPHPAADRVSELPLSSEEQARSFLASVDEMVYYQGLDGSLAMLNDANARITGYSLEEWAANPQLWREIVHPDDQLVAEEFFARYPEGTASFEVEYRLRAKIGEWRWIQSRMVGVKDASGRYIGYNCVDRNITEQKKVELELKEHRDHLDQLVEERTRELAAVTRAAEEANQAKTRFLANMSHEIRTPMNAVLGFSHLLETSELNDKQSNYLQIIRRNATSLLAIIDDILDLSRIEAGRLELELLDFDLHATVRSVLESFGQRAKSKGLSLQYQIDAAVPAARRGDPGRLRQILINLIGNAIKFTSDGEVSVVVQNEDGPELMLRFEVRDTGIGIPAAETADLFEAFSQVDTSTTRHYDGAGLGLSIARQLCELMDGEIGVDSEPGEGSTFWFTARFDKPLSAAGTEAELAASADSEHDDLWSRFREQNLRILVVEDNETNQMVATAILHRMGCRTDIAVNGLEAVKALGKTSFDLVLMDIQMPEMDGLEAAREIRRRQREASGPGNLPRPIPIVAMTAHAMSGDRKKCLEAGMDDYLSKPIQLDNLVQILDRWTDIKPRKKPPAP